MEQEDGRTGKGKGKGRGERREVSLGDAVTRKLWAGPEMLRWTLRAGTVATVHWEQGERAGGLRGEGGGETAYLLGGGKWETGEATAGGARWASWEKR